MTDNALGMGDSQTYVTNEAQLTSASVTENMRLYAFEVCSDVAGNV